MSIHMSIHISIYTCRHTRLCIRLCTCPYTCLYTCLSHRGQLVGRHLRARIGTPVHRHACRHVYRQAVAGTERGGMGGHHARLMIRVPVCVRLVCLLQHSSFPIGVTSLQPVGARVPAAVCWLVKGRRRWPAARHMCRASMSASTIDGDGATSSLGCLGIGTEQCAVVFFLRWCSLW